ncbi:response regulator [Methylobacterium sp. NEAU 140]|uniref:hybrid sensor histidine kinase/response regulator n=1 Tax=Methylobacterium sp. NEAU 140 TaxID=3064945 RepID=UPI0027331AF3|nr:response regulator [Methylobacterium sp. NEAU 140]MDP4025055.1 response regulator [Methylobacterium sp. NEAU 140]
MAADIRQLLLAAFDVEHREHVAAIRAALGAEAPDWNDVFRRAHSLKGAARAVDLPAIEAVAHRLETLFERVRTGATALDREAANAVNLALDRIEAHAAGLTDGAAPDMPGDALAALGRRLGLPGEPAEEVTVSAPVSAPGPTPEPPPEPAAETPPTPPPTPLPTPPSVPSGQNAAEAQPDGGGAILRVPAEAVEALARASADLASALGTRIPAAEGFGRLARLARDLRGRAEALAASGAAPGLRDLALGLGGLAREAADLTRRHAAGGLALEGAAARVQAEAERLALVPAETVLGPLARSLRETAREGGRDVDVRVSGLDLPVERGTLQALKDPLLHALRNALSHAWQPPEVRRAAGKPETLAVELEVAVRGSRLRVAVHDDGPGPDLARIAAAARAAGLLAPDAPADPESLLRLVFEPGFSTAGAVDTLAGRGYGLAVAAEAAARLQGGVRLERREPAGTSLVFSLPLAASRRSLLLVEAGGQTYALPSDAVERLLRLPRADLPRAMGRPILRLGAAGSEETLPVADLAALLGGTPDPDPATVTALVLRGRARAALAVDRLREVRALLVLPAPGFGADPELIAGTAVLPGDAAVLVLDPDGLAVRAGRAAPAAGTIAEAPRSASRAAGGASPGASSGASPRATILVVDDSITTRTLEKGILEAAGYRVVVCVDGQDALDRLRAEVEPVDLVLADVEMPRLDGFGLVGALRADPRFARLPTVLMTSRGDAEDVARGLDLGADAYLTKQTFDQRQLLDTIGQLL